MSNENKSRATSKCTRDFCEKWIWERRLCRVHYEELLAKRKGLTPLAEQKFLHCISRDNVCGVMKFEKYFSVSLSTSMIDYGWTPAHWACFFGSINVLKVLARNGADLNSPSLHSVGVDVFTSTTNGVRLSNGYPLDPNCKCGDIQCKKCFFSTGSIPLHIASRVEAFPDSNNNNNNKVDSNSHDQNSNNNNNNNIDNDNNEKQRQVNQIHDTLPAETEIKADKTVDKQNNIDSNSYDSHQHQPSTERSDDDDGKQQMQVNGVDKPYSERQGDDDDDDDDDEQTNADSDENQWVDLSRLQDLCSYFLMKNSDATDFKLVENNAGRTCEQECNDDKLARLLTRKYSHLCRLQLAEKRAVLLMRKQAEREAKEEEEAKGEDSSHKDNTEMDEGLDQTVEKDDKYIAIMSDVIADPYADTSDNEKNNNTNNSNSNNNKENDSGKNVKKENSRKRKRFEETEKDCKSVSNGGIDSMMMKERADGHVEGNVSPRARTAMQEEPTSVTLEPSTKRRRGFLGRLFGLR